MLSWLRIALVWLLVAALPVQSWAAATLAHCGPRHIQMAAEAGPHATAARVDSMASPGGHAHDHHAAARVSADNVNAVHMPHADPSLHKLGKSIGNDGGNDGGNGSETDKRKHTGKCSACASCCFGVALPSASISFDASAPPGAPVAGMFRATAVFLTGGLERPPRTLLI